MKKPILQIFKDSEGRWSTKWEHYFDVYERHLSRYRDQEVYILEFGVYQGGSLQVMKEYFGSSAKIFGVDINPACKELEEEQVKIFIGDQENPSFLNELQKRIPRIDVLIDDGGHTMKQQITTFKVMYDAIEEDGVYICEDLHTSYWPRFGGGLHKKETFVNHSKKLVDDLHAYHLDQPNRLDLQFCSSTDSLHFYDSMLVIENRKRMQPKEVETGIFDKDFPSVVPDQPNRTFLDKIVRRVSRRLRRIMR